MNRQNMDFEEQRRPEEIQRRFRRARELLKILVQQIEEEKVMTVDVEEAEKLVVEIVQFYGSPDASTENYLPRPGDFLHSFCKGRWATEGGLNLSDIKVVILLGGFFQEDLPAEEALIKAQNFLSQLEPELEDSDMQDIQTLKETIQILQETLDVTKTERNEALEGRRAFRTEVERLKRECESLRNQIPDTEKEVDIDYDGSKRWYLYGDRSKPLHREGGPAVILSDGSKHWYMNGQLHREGGPAVENADGTKMWFRNDERHREGGPAIEWADGDGEWWEYGKKIFEKRSDEEGVDWAVVEESAIPLTPSGAIESPLDEPGLSHSPDCWCKSDDPQEEAPSLTSAILSLCQTISRVATKLDERNQ